MLAALHSRCIHEACTRIPFVIHHSALNTSLAASRRLPQSRLFHFGLASSVAKTGALASQGTASPASQAEPKRLRVSPVNKTSVPWSEDEKARFEYLYSDGKNPSPASILALFPSRSRSALYGRLFLYKGGIPRKNWSPEDEARLLELHSAGVSNFDLFKHFPGRTQVAVMKKLDRTLPNSYFTDRRRMVSSSVLEEDNRVKGGDHNYDENNGAIVTAARIRKRMTPWTEEEDEILKSLVRKAKERSPDRWTAELSRLLSDVRERKGLSIARTMDVCAQRLKRLDSGPFVVKAHWTENENNLLMRSVYSRLGIPLHSTSNPESNTPRKTKDNNGSSQSGHRTRASKNNTEKVHWPEISMEKLKTLDWHQVALDVGTRGSNACRQRFDGCFKLRKGQRWTDKEIELLKEGLRKYGRDWTMVASVVATRTATQALTKYKHIITKTDKLTKGSQGSLEKDLEE